MSKRWLAGEKTVSLEREISNSDGEGITIHVGPGVRISLKTGETRDCIAAEIRRHNSTPSGRRNGGEVVMRLIANESEGYPELIETVAEMWRHGEVPIS